MKRFEVRLLSDVLAETPEEAAEIARSWHPPTFPDVPWDVGLGNRPPVVEVRVAEPKSPKPTYKWVRFDRWSREGSA
jgi:hypothetical protein